MHILYVSHTHPEGNDILQNVGGMQRVSYQLIKVLQKKSDIVLQPETIHAGFNGNVGLQTTRFLLKLLFSLKKKVRLFKPDVILFSSMVTASLAPFLRNRLNVPLVTINHGRDVTLTNSAYQRFVPAVFNALDGVISVSEATRQECIKRGMEPEKGIALPNGIDTGSFTFPAKNESRLFIKKAFNIPLEDHKMLLTVGRFVERKGHRWFIEEVLPLINSKVVYVTIGDGPELENVKNMAKMSQKSKKIFILGRQSDDILKKAYSAADLFIMPNIPVEGDMEGFGIVMVEANLAQTPAIASDIEGIKDVITNGKNGFKVRPLMAKKFAKTVDGTLSDNLNLLSTQSRKHVQEQFDWTHVADLYVQFLKETAKKYPRKL